jgi:L-threonylcarbamoyladenylate synthase
MTNDSRQPAVILWPPTDAEQAALIAQIIRVLSSDGVVALPTDTVYGLAAHAARPGAIEQLFAIKQRPPAKQIALLIDDPASMDELAADVPPAAESLARRYWPGALTLVLRGREGQTIAFRQPDHPIPRAVIRALGHPIATTSANLSGHASPRSAAEVLAQLATGYDLLIDGGLVPVGADSTVLDCSGPNIRLLRPGPLDRTELEALVGAIEGS